MEIAGVDLARLFHLETSLSELILRGSILYIGILFLMRIMPRRTGGELAVMDLVFVLLIAEAAAHSLGEYTSVTDGFVLIITMCLWDYLVNVLSYHFPFVERLVSSSPIQVIKNGRLLRRNMRREYLTEEELINHLRKEGIGDINEVKVAHIEGDGTISVITNNGG